MYSTSSCIWTFFSFLLAKITPRVIRTPMINSILKGALLKNSRRKLSFFIITCLLLKKSNPDNKVIKTGPTKQIFCTGFIVFIFDSEVVIFEKTVYLLPESH